MPLYRDDLDAPPAGDAGAGDAPAGDLWFHAKCHLDSPTWARYRDGVLTIQCARCERDVVALVIARRPPAAPPSPDATDPGPAA